MATDRIRSGEDRGRASPPLSGDNYISKCNKLHNCLKKWKCKKWVSKMQFKNKAAEERFETWRAAQTSDYEKVIFIFAERWADGIEDLLEWLPDEDLGSIARRAECEACEELNLGSMSGYSYGCAVALLADVWKHGEALRRWHNRDPTNPASHDPRAVAEANDRGETLVFCGLTVPGGASRGS